MVLLTKKSEYIHSKITLKTVSCFKFNFNVQQWSSLVEGERFNFNVQLWSSLVVVEIRSHNWSRMEQVKNGPYA